MDFTGYHNATSEMLPLQAGLRAGASVLPVAGESVADQTGDFPRGVTRERIGEEVARIAAAPDFARAPVMRRLLEFLVRETLAGRGDGLKAYAVAVDGLGRPHDFDAQADSYPRVQVGRLRRMLDTFYARHEAKDGVRLHIPAGQYAVFFTVDPPPVETAGASAEEHAAGSAPVEPASPSPTSPSAQAPSALADANAKLRLAAALLAITVIAIIASAVYLARRDASEAPPPLSRPPSLVIDRITAPPEMDAIEVDAEAVLLDGLRRSWLVRVHDAVDLTAPRRPTSAAYRLTGAISSDRPHLLRLKLVRGDAGQLIWTGQVPMPTERERLRETLTPLIAELVQPYGVIATDQRAAPGNRFMPGYRCILEFDRYRRDRTEGVHGKLIECIDRTLALDPGNALALAAKSMLVIDPVLYRFTKVAPSDLPQRSLALATRAAAADPYSAFAQLAVARAAQFAATCGMSTRASRRAIALDPYDPDLAGIAGILLLNCDDPGAEALLRRAFSLDSDPPPNIQTSLIFILLDRGDIAGARRMADALPPPTAAIRPISELTRAVVAARAGDAAQARATWRVLERIDPQTAANPSSLFERWMLPERFRAQSLAALAGAGIVPGPAQSSSPH